MPSHKDAAATETAPGLQGTPAREGLAGLGALGLKKPFQRRGRSALGSASLPAQLGARSCNPTAPSCRNGGVCKEPAPPCKSKQTVSWEGGFSRSFLWQQGLLQRHPRQPRLCLNSSCNILQHFLVFSSCEKATKPAPEHGAVLEHFLLS